MQLTNNFTLQELCKSQTATRKGIDNSPVDEQIINNLKLLAANILQPVRDNFALPFTPSSGYRSPALNEAIGGSATSQHSKGQAADIEVPTIPNIDLAKWIVGELKFDQLILEFYKEDDPTAGWIHVSYVDLNIATNRHEVLSYDGKSYQKGLVL
tara:strand:- start:806 stop:1270 length:465 start_codon:yes stop_codon:yes gene_type:complete